MYSDIQREQALSLYSQCKSATMVIQQLGYPTRQTLYKWLEESSLPPKEKGPRKKWINTPEHPRVPPAELKLEAIHRCFELGENIQLVSEEIGYSRTSIYVWHKKYLRDGDLAFTKTSTDSRFHLPNPTSSDSQEIEQLKSLIHDMQSEIAVLKRSLELAQKEPPV